MADFFQIKTNTGFRFYYFGEKKFLRAEPRISISFAIDENTYLKSAFAVADQFLHLIVRNDISLPTDLWYPSTKNVEPSKSTQYVAGIDRYFSNQKYLLSLEGYYRDMEHLYEFKSTSKLDPFSKNIEQQFTSGRGEAYGIELFFNKREGNLTGWIGYTLSWTRRQFDELNNGKSFYPKYDRLHDLSIVISYKIFENLNTGITWTYSTGQRFTIPPGQYSFDNIGFNENSSIQFNTTELNGSKFPTYHKLDLNLTYNFKLGNSSFETYLNIYNLYNRHNPFAQYLTLVDDPSSPNDAKIPKLKRLTLFPFIPTVGFSYKF